MSFSTLHSHFMGESAVAPSVKHPRRRFPILTTVARKRLRRIKSRPPPRSYLKIVKAKVVTDPEAAPMNYAQVRRSRAKANGGWDDDVTMKALLARDGEECSLCGRQVITGLPWIDHIVPLSKGGSHTWDNVQVAHHICNARKGVRAA